MLLKKSVEKIISKAGQIISREDRLQKEIYYSVLFNQVTQNSPWLNDKSFAPGRWAVDYCFLYTMYRALEVVRPKSILDIGLGQTTKMLSQYASLGGQV